MTTTTLTADQSGDPDDAGYILASVAAAGPRERDFLIQIGSELEYVEWRGDQHARPWQVVRGYLGTAPATHSSGATVTLEPSLAVGGGVTVTGSQGGSVAGATEFRAAGLVEDLGGGIAGQGLVFNVKSVSVAFDTAGLVDPNDDGPEVFAIPAGSIFRVSIIATSDWSDLGDLTVVAGEVSGSHTAIIAEKQALTLTGNAFLAVEKSYDEFGATDDHFPAFAKALQACIVAVAFYTASAAPTTGSADLLLQIATPAS